MFLLRRRVAPAPAVAPEAPVAPPPLDHDEVEETKRLTILFAGIFGCQLFLLFLYNFWKQPENFELQPMDQYHRFMAVIMLFLLMVVLYHIVFVSYERAESVILIATPLFVSLFFAKKICKHSSKISFYIVKFTYFPHF